VAGNDTTRRSIAEGLSNWLARPTKATAIIDLPEVFASIGTTIGEARRENQDRALVVRFATSASRADRFIACVLADGMGGMVEGARCAEIALGTFVDELVRDGSAPIETKLRLATEAANAQVYRQFRQRGGTTIVGLVLSELWAVGVSAGDSRLHSFSPLGRLRQISVDDTIAGEVKRLTGDYPIDDEGDSSAAQLVQYVGMGDGIKPRVYEIKPRRPDERYLISSDGASGVPFEAFEKVVTHAPSVWEAARRAIHLSNWCGGRDNTSVICIDPRAISTLSTSSKMAPGLVEVWDSFSKVEFFFERPSGLSDGAASEHERSPVSEGPQAGRLLGTRDASSPPPSSATKKKSRRAGVSKRPRPPQTEPDRRPLQIEILQVGHVPYDQAKPVESPEAKRGDSKGTAEGECNEKLSTPAGPSHVLAPAPDGTAGDESVERRSRPPGPSEAATPRSDEAEPEKHAEKPFEPSEPQPSASRSGGMKAAGPTDQQPESIQPPLISSMPGSDVGKHHPTPGERRAPEAGRPDARSYSEPGNGSVNHGHQGDN
jgi:serine/threonine protein phosphatase PrpC